MAAVLPFIKFKQHKRNSTTNFELFEKKNVYRWCNYEAIRNNNVQRKTHFSVISVQHMKLMFLTCYRQIY